MKEPFFLKKGCIKILFQYSLLKNLAKITQSNLSTYGKFLNDLSFYLIVLISSQATENQ